MNIQQIQYPVSDVEIDAYKCPNFIMLYSSPPSPILPHQKSLESVRMLKEAAVWVAAAQLHRKEEDAVVTKSAGLRSHRGSGRRPEGGGRVEKQYRALFPHRGRYF